MNTKFRLAAADVDTSSEPEDIYVRRLGAQWLYRVLECDSVCLDDNFFTCLGFIMGGYERMLSLYMNNLAVPEKHKKRVKNPRLELKKICSEVSKRKYPDQLESYYCLNTLMQKPMKDLSIDYLRSFCEEYGTLAALPQERNLKKIFGLDDMAVKLVILTFMMENYSSLLYYLNHSLDIFDYENRSILAHLLGMPVQKCLNARHLLNKLGIIKNVHNELRLTSKIFNAMASGSLRDMRSCFYKPLGKTNVPLEQFRISEEDKNIALKLFQRKSQEPVHLLLYGPPGTGKTSFASCIAQILNEKAWSVVCREDDDANARRASISASLYLAAQNPGSFVLVDESEIVLNTNFDTLHNSTPKAWLNDLLETKGSRIIWITNNVTGLDEALMRRFSHSIYFEKLGVSERMQMWNNVAQRQHVESRLPLKERERLAKKYDVPVATMEKVAHLAKGISGQKGFCQCMERLLDAQITLRNYGQKPALKNEISLAEYDPNALCASTPIEPLCQKVEKLADLLSRGGQTRPGMGSILFYGPPGTGKTALALYLAERIGLECLKMRASDLLGPYVGETEANIAAAFQKAEHRKAILLIDEADSFLGSREKAHRTWEQSMVNEFLTALESFYGICICTTNFQTGLDTASMRRFSIKVEFGYLHANQLRNLYHKILEPLLDTPASEDMLNILENQKRLTPGDFQAVKLRFWLEERQNISHKILLEALLAEQRLKLEYKPVGF